ncbi:serpin family protein [Clostridium sp. CF012]|uniref:serpin family protein n=1 Tax=Clostridium sp. CF012 TaxID=2843319 RepID=UPI001C0CF401|nr:serpin family protein [Clostridium sp. CF012]MBU3142842.1 serpin family protein [Clostridium sp. CF012]
MKKILSFAVCIVVIANLVACNSDAKSTAVKAPVDSKSISFDGYDSSNATVKTTIYPKSISFDDYDSRSEVMEENSIDESYKKALNKFSFSSASKILSGQSKNISYSPTSLYMTLSLASIGANGVTQDEIFSVLGASGKGINYLSEQNSKLFRLMYSDNKIGKLKIANSLWLEKNISFKNTFIDNAVRNFYASIYNVDFSDDNSAKLMSKWVSENTNGILSPKMSIDKNQIMSIINTIYFKDEWVDLFDENNTKPDTFYFSDGGEIKGDFMNRTYAAHSYVKGDGFTSASLGLKNSSSMMFILPDKGMSVDDLLSTPEKTALLFDEKEIKSGKVIFQIPKFSFGNSLDLNNTLKIMGIKSAFQPEADFSGISQGAAFISNIKQQTHIAIDEKGVEATAFTKIDYDGSAAPKENVAKMILDRPFIFVIKSANDMILFIGVVNNPSIN